MTRLLVAAYLVVAGLVLTVTPWTLFWERNYFAQAWPWVGVLMSNPYVRGGVTGVGVITAIVAIRDLASTLFARGDAPRPPVEGDRPRG